MSASIRRRRLVLAIAVIALAVAPVLVTPAFEAQAQVDTTSTTEPQVTTLPPPPTTTTAPPTTTTTTRPTTTTTRRTTTTRPAPTTTTVPPTTTTVSSTTTTTATTTTLIALVTTTTRRPPSTTTSLIVTTTTGFVPPSSAGPGGGGEDGSSSFGGLPPWSLPFVGAGAMLAAIVLATGVVRLATQGLPAVGRGFGSLAYKTSNGWARLTTKQPPPPPSHFTDPKPTLGARIGGFFLALTSPFRRLGRASSGRDTSARRLRIHRQATVGGMWDRLVLKARMTRARFGQTRSSVDGHKRYWWLRFRRYLPWLR